MTTDFFDREKIALLKRAKEVLAIAGSEFPGSRGKLFFGVDHESNEYLLVPGASKKDVARIATLQFRGIGFSIRELESINFPLATYIVIHFEGRIGEKTIGPISENICELLLEDSLEPGRVVEVVFEKWRNFWGAMPEQRLSETDAIGLIGEMYFLKNWLFPTLTYERSVDSWEGAMKSNQDFRIGRAAIEIKASRNMASRSHDINGLDQLNTKNIDLYVLSLKTRSSRLEKYSLKSWIDDVKNCLDREPKTFSQFERKLLDANYHEIDEDLYENYRFEVDAPVLYQVREGFPKLSREELPSDISTRISGLNYKLDFEGLDDFIIGTDPSALAEVLNTI